MTLIRQVADTTEEQIKNVQTLVRRSWLASLGVAGLVQDTTKTTFNKAVRRGEGVADTTREELKKINTRLRSEQAKLSEDVEDAEETIERKVTDVLTNFNVPSRRDLRVLDTRINQLNVQLRELNTVMPDGSREPLQNYDAMNVEEINAVLPTLIIEDLYAVESYERSHVARVTILREVERQIGQRLTEQGEISEPFAGYDALRVEEVIARLEGMSLSELRHIKLYESTHAKRVTVQRAIDNQIEIVWEQTPQKV